MPIVSGKYTNKADSLRVHDWNSLFEQIAQKNT